MNKILIIHAHWNNRGDEAAVRALVDELLKVDSIIDLQLVSTDVNQFPYKENVTLIPLYPRFRQIPEFLLACLSKGKLVLSREGKAYFKSLRECELVLHAPGGPSLGDTYSISEILYILRYLSVIRLKKRFIICAPSMGPFKRKIRNIFRKKILSSAEQIILRENISKSYLDELWPQNKAIVTLDAAFQNNIDIRYNENLLRQYEDLDDFLNTNKKVIGVTITDLLWHPKLSNPTMANNISRAFSEIISKLVSDNYRILFIPQLFGEANDYNLMKNFEQKDCFTLSDQYDCNFQQFIISKMYALIGMRYHSNIFSAKMGIPFISISYEQKMIGFMRAISFDKWCIPLDSMSADTILEKFNALENNYVECCKHLNILHDSLKMKSYETTKIVLEALK